MTIRVRLFAILRDQAGVSDFPLALPGGATVSDARDRIAARYPALQAHLPRVAFAVNRAYCKPDQAMSEGDELALIPPVSGGSGACN